MHLTIRKLSEQSVNAITTVMNKNPEINTKSKAIDFILSHYSKTLLNAEKITDLYHKEKLENASNFELLAQIQRTFKMINNLKL